MAPGARSKFGVPMFEPEVFRKQMYCTEVPVILLGLFGARGIVPLAPVVPPVIIARSDSTKPWYTAPTRGIREPWASGGNFSICPNFCVSLRKTNRKVLQGDSSA